MSELTKEKAIEESFILWTELARNGQTKVEAAKAVGLDHVIEYASRCPCCEYVQQIAGTCNTCPVWWSTHLTCRHVYNKWRVATTLEEHREAAAKVLEPITEAWEKISKEKKNGNKRLQGS